MRTAHSKNERFSMHNSSEASIRISDQTMTIQNTSTIASIPAGKQTNRMKQQMTSAKKTHGTQAFNRRQSKSPFAGSSKKMRIVSKSRFALSMTLILVFILSTSMIAFATFDGKSDKDTPTSQLFQHIDKADSAPLTYTVKSGDTLWSIASGINKEHYNQEKDIRKIVYAIRKANKMKGNTIYSGQILNLPI